MQLESKEKKQTDMQFLKQIITNNNQIALPLHAVRIKGKEELDLQ